MPKKTPTVSSFYIKILLAFLLAIGILAAIGLFTMQTVLQMSRNNEVVLHSYKIKENLAKTLLELTLSQNDLRAYYLTDKKQYLYLYRGRIDSVRHSAAIVEGLIADKMYQHLYFKTLDSLLQERFTFNDKKIRMAYFQGHDAAEKKYSTERNQKILGEIENVANQLDAGESRLLESQIAESRVRINKTILFLSAGGLTSVAILLFVFLFLNKEVNRRTEAENEIRESEKRFFNFLEAVPVGIYILTADGKPYYQNEEAKKILGQGMLLSTAPESLAEAYRIYVQGTDTIYPWKKNPLVLALTGKRGSTADMEVWREDKVVPLFVTGAPIYDIDGELKYAMAAFVDISEQKDAEQKLADSEERYRQIIEYATDIIYRTDRRGNLTYVNPVGLKVFGYSENDVHGMPYDNVINVHEKEAVKRFYLRQALSKTLQTYHEFSAITHDGREIILGQNVRLLIKNSEVQGFLVVARDVTRQKKAEEELTAAKEAAESATKAKSQFLATMSHEIRTPMNGVIGMTDLLLQTELTAEQREYSEIIRTSGETLLTLINDILDFSKIESGKLDLEERPIELQGLIEESFDLVAHRAVEKNIDLLYLIDPSVPPFIVGDSTRFRQILLNLTNNAIKFTEKGEVFVSVTELSRERMMTELQFAVKDTGIGIAADKIDKLFLTFSQVDASTTRKYGGTGLGLAITKRLVELMQGKIWVESEEGKGTTFFFTVKIPLVDAKDAPARKYVRGKIPELQGKRVLLVDDNKTNLNILSIQCINWGMLPRATTSHEEALTWLRANDPFDIAILDFHMPGKDGIQLAKEIRQLRDTQSLPLVLFSSSLRNEYGENQESLFAASIMKPLKQTQLYSTLLDVVALAPSVRYKKITERTVTEEKISGRYPLSILVAEDNIVNQKLAMRLLLKLGYDADIAANGNIVLEMMAKKNYDIVFMDLHMPERDGLETTRSIVNSVPLPIRPKIIAMTADAMTGDREKCINAGMDDYISKPVRLEVLKTVLQSFGELILEHRAVFSDEKLESLIRHRTKELLDETDKEFILEFIGGFPGQAEESIDSLRTAVQEKNLGDAVFHAHKLRGLGLNFGGESLAAACREIEAIQSESVLEFSAPDLLKSIEVELQRTLSIIARVRGELL